MDGGKLSLGWDKMRHALLKRRVIQVWQAKPSLSKPRSPELEDDLDLPPPMPMLYDPTMRLRDQLLTILSTVPGDLVEAKQKLILID